jgi:putative hemolysin
MEALTPETLAWASRIGLTPDRVAFLMACPKYTHCNEHMKHRAPMADNPNRYLMKSGHKYYFRRKLQGVICHTPLSTNIEEARRLRDELLAKHKAQKMRTAA